MLAAFALGLDKKDSPAIWIQMNEGRLAAVLENDPDESIEIYNALLHDLSSQHPAYGELKFWLQVGPAKFQRFLSIPL